MNVNNLQYRVGFLGCPPRPDTPWTQQNLERLKDLGFNTIQLNIAWGYRPGDEPLNLEDLIRIVVSNRTILKSSSESFIPFILGF